MTLPVPDARSGLWSRILTADRCIDDTAWRYHVDALQHVGKCRRDQQPLKPRDSYTVGAVTWYTAECISPLCDYEVAMHGPRPKKGT